MKKSLVNRVWSALWPYLFFIIVITLMIYPQLRAGVLTKGGDTYFHFARFYDAAMQLKNHTFSLFQSDYGFYQSGRVINAVYGPAFAYLNGALILLCKTWFNYQIVTDYIIGLIGAATMLHLLRYVKVNKILAVLLSALYINIGLIPTYLNSSSFNSWGQAFMPLVLLCGVKMIKDRQQPINWIQLMVVMSIMAQIHMLSTLLATLLLIPFFIVSVFLNHNSAKLWLNLVKAVVGTLFLTANVWGAYLILMSSNTLGLPDPYNLMFSGVRITGYSGYHGTYGTVFGYMLPLIALLFVAQFIYVIFHFKQDIVNTVATFVGIILLAVASNYFPWGFVQRKLPFLQTSFQFPFRFVAIIYPLLVLGIGLTIQNNFVQIKWKKLVSFALVGVVFLESFASTVRTNQYYSLNHTGGVSVQKASRSKDLSEFFITAKHGKQPDYLPVSGKQDAAEYKKLYISNVIDNYGNYQHTVTKAGAIKLTWTGKESKKVTLPIVMYAQSELLVNDHKFNGTKNKIGNPIIRQRKGSNEAILSFKVPTLFYVLLAITIISWLAVLIYSISFRKSR